MAITFTGSGGAFERFGYLWGWADLLLTAPIPDDIESRLRTIRHLAHDILIDITDTDNPLRALTIEYALREFIAQMVTQSEDVDRTTVSAAVNAAGGNTGDGTLIVSVANPDGDDWESMRAEDIVFECFEDSQAGRVDAGSELFRVQGEAAVDEMDPAFPKGSGIDRQIVSSSGEIDAGRVPGANVLTNGDFEDWTGTTAKQWIEESAGSDIALTATSYRGTNALKIVGDGATLVKVNQAIDAGAGTFGLVFPWEKYLISYRVRDDGTGPSTGVLSVALRNAGDDSIVDAAVTTDLTAVGSSYVHKTGVISTPSPLPASLEFDIRLTTALQSGRDVYIDQVQLIRMVPLYRGGLYAALVSGATDWVAMTDTADGDNIVVTVTNNDEGEIVKHFERFFGMTKHALQLPSAASGLETVDDALVL